MDNKSNFDIPALEVERGRCVKSQKSEEVAVRGRKTATSLSEQEAVEPAPHIPPAGQYGLDEKGGQDAARVAATGGLAIILGQLVTYFTNRAHIDDLDVLSFSLHHLFCRVDFLYNTALPELASWTTATRARPTQPDARTRQQIWTHLQTINRALDRMEPLC